MRGPRMLSTRSSLPWRRLERMWRLRRRRGGGVRGRQRSWRLFTHRCEDWYLIAEQPALTPHLAHPERCAALRIVLLPVPCVSRSCEHFPDGFDLHLLRTGTNLVASPEHFKTIFFSRAEDTRETPTQRHLSPSILVYDDNVSRKAFTYMISGTKCGMMSPKSTEWFSCQAESGTQSIRWRDWTEGVVPRRARM